MKKALVIGINKYPTKPLKGAINDAKDISELLQVNGNDTTNFEVRPIYDVQTKTELMTEITSFFNHDADMGLLYFAGHGYVNELGGFYLDVIKDRQYTTQANSLARHSAQTALYYIVEAMVRWIAPITSFTADEIWKEIPGEREEFVFLDQWYNGLPTLNENTEMGAAFWQSIMAVKTAVNKQLELGRKEGVIGGSLAAQVTLFCDGSLAQQLHALGDELRFVLITSTAVIKPLTQSEGATATEVDGLEVKVAASEQAKCDRCWHHREDVGSHNAHPELCGRCVDNIEGDGEKRFYA